MGSRIWNQSFDSHQSLEQVKTKKSKKSKNFDLNPIILKMFKLIILTVAILAICDAQSPFGGQISQQGGFATGPFGGQISQGAFDQGSYNGGLSGGFGKGQIVQQGGFKGFPQEYDIAQGTYNGGIGFGKGQVVQQGGMKGFEKGGIGYEKGPY